MSEFLQCVGPRVWRDVRNAIVTFGGLIGLILVVSLLGCLLSGAAAACLPAWFDMLIAGVGLFVALVMLFAIISMLVNSLVCALSGLGGLLEDFIEDELGVDVEDAVSSALEERPTDCVSAQQALASVEAELRAAELARDAQRERAENARRRVDAAVTALTATVAALAAAAFWRPDLVPGLVAAIVAAGALLLQRLRRSADEARALAAAEAEVVRAAAAVAVAATLVDVLCPPGVPPPPKPPEPPDLGSIGG